MLKKWIPIWVVPVFIAFSIGTVWLRLTIIRTSYSIHQTERIMDTARRDREDLQLKVAALRSPRRLEILARTKYGLSQPKMEQIVHLKKSEIMDYNPSLATLHNNNDP